MKKLIYFHGFGSSGEGGTVKTLRELLPDWIILAPDIPVDPKDALLFEHRLNRQVIEEVVAPLIWEKTNC